MDPTFPPGHPAQYSAAAALPLPPAEDLIYGPPPPEALESNANRNLRQKKERSIRRLNNPSSFYNGLRDKFLEREGIPWSAARTQIIQQFKNEQAQKAATRFAALKAHRNAEWQAYVARYMEEHRNNIPKRGPPPRISYGYGGGTRRRRQRNRRRTAKRRV